jgi:hypothetical protein
VNARRSVTALAALLASVVAPVALAQSGSATSNSLTASPTTSGAATSAPATAAATSPSGSAGVSLGSLAGLSSKDAASGLRAALGQGIDKAVAKLGVPNGFTSDARFTIPLPGPLAKAEKMARALGYQKDADALKASMNRAAELAVAEAKPAFRKALTGMTLADAKSIVAGGETSATDYFRKATTEELTAKFKPIVAKATEQVKVASAYDRFAGKAASLGLIKAQDANLNDYVTAKAMDALFLAVADEERAIRKDPLGQASSLLRKVFGGG